MSLEKICELEYFAQVCMDVYGMCLPKEVDGSLIREDRLLVMTGAELLE
jgi:hypothetical protein